MPVRQQLMIGAQTLRGVAEAVAAVRRKTPEHQPQPPASGLVLDVGSGQEADPRADVIVEKYLTDDFERSTARAADLSRPLVVADGHALPFADGAFAYAIASHVIEHATDPVGFAAQLSRVAAAGFVQVPSRESELVFGWDFHPWLIDRDGDTLVFAPRGDAVAPVGHLFHQANADSVLFRLWFASERQLWHHSVHWRGTLHVRVEGRSEAPRTAQLDVARTLELLAELSRRNAVRGPQAAVRAALRCPLDGGALEVGRERAVCASCGRDYPIVGTVPVLLEEAAGVLIP